MIDLHMHSTFSDGTFTPEVLAEQAATFGLTAVALTDHDGTGGVSAFLAACAAHGVRGISGVEISAQVKKGTMHILGYFIDHDDPGLDDVLVRIREGRERRNREILEKLCAQGCPLEWDEVCALSEEDVVGRPHFAMAMQARGYVADKMEAFNRYLAKGKPAYAERFRLGPAESMAAIRKAGGVPVLAHPFTLGLSRKALYKTLCELRSMGLEGIEAYYSEHTEETCKAYVQMADELGLAISGGSDFHGDVNPKLKMGIGFGHLRVPDELVAGLEARRG